MTLEYVIVLSAEDPVARAVGERWGTPPVVSQSPDSGPLRRLRSTVGLLRRSGLHIHDDGVAVPPESPGGPPPTLVFPSVHRSATARPTLTVHPLGNPGPTAEVGGIPGRLVTVDARRMTDALRRVADVADRLAWAASFEATHHGPAVAQPAFFVEIGAPDFAHPPADAVSGFADLLPELAGDPRDRVAIGLGGGHYAPHFTELARERRWAFGHLLPRHALELGGAGLVRSALAATPGAEGILYHRAQDAEAATWSSIAPRLRDKEVPERAAPG